MCTLQCPSLSLSLSLSDTACCDHCAALYRYTHLPPGRMHPACCIAKASWPKRWGCRWHETLRIRQGKFSSVWFQTAMPWVHPEQYSFASVDFTPNYLCHMGALRNINATARDPNELRFIVLMRDPIMRAFSEWSMFTTWGWDKEKVGGSSSHHDPPLTTTHHHSPLPSPSLPLSRLLSV